MPLRGISEMRVCDMVCCHPRMADSRQTETLLTSINLHYPLQYSGLENAMDCIIVHGITNSQTRLSHFHFPYIHRDWSTQVLGWILFKRVYFNNLHVYSNLNPGKEWKTAPLSESEVPLNHCEYMSMILPLWISVPFSGKRENSHSLVMEEVGN